jgi:bacterioferritin (cytochrome b1)
MGFDLERSETRKEPTLNELPTLDDPSPSDDGSNFSQALSRNLLAERFAIDAYRKIAENANNCDKATLRLVKVALAVEEEHAEILSTILENLRNLNGALAG